MGNKRERYDDPLSGSKAEMREKSSKNLAFFSFYLWSESCCRVEWMLFDREMKRPVGMRWRGEREREQISLFIAELRWIQKKQQQKVFSHSSDYQPSKFYV